MTAIDINAEKRELNARRQAAKSNPKALPWFLSQFYYVKSLILNGND